MTPLTSKDKQHLEDMVTILADHFNVSKPTLCYADIQRASYRPINNTIMLPMTPYRCIEDTVLHEFAHHMHRAVEPIWEERKRKREARRAKLGYTEGDYYVRTRISSHDLPFRTALTKAVLAWYGKTDRYAWLQEYPCIAKRGPVKL